MIDLVVEGNAYLDGEIKKCCVGIEAGKIVAIKKLLKAEHHLDFGDKLILPAGIDIHVHFREPGFTNKEDFYTGTMAAAFGGISCVFDMPNTNPPTVTKDTVQEKIGIVEKKAFVDFGIYSSVTPKTNIRSTAEACSGFKIYLGSTTGKLLFSSEMSLESVLSDISQTGRITAFHAETESIIKSRAHELTPIKDLHTHMLSRSNDAELDAITRIIRSAKRSVKPSQQNQKSKKLPGTQIHICHVTSAEGVNQIKSLSNDDIIVTSEVTPHHLLLNEGSDLGTLGKVNPPLRTPSDQTALWDGLRHGTIRVIASDHAPHTIDEKNQEFENAPAGLPGVETTLPLMLSQHKHHKIPLDRLVSAISVTPASIFNLPKGKLAEGFDGDLIVVDFYQEEKIAEKNLHSKCGWSPFNGMPAIFPLLTVIRGEIIIKDGNMESEPGFGKFYN
jgi:dihydroorotase